MRARNPRRELTAAAAGALAGVLVTILVVALWPDGSSGPGTAPLSASSAPQPTAGASAGPSPGPTGNGSSDGDTGAEPTSAPVLKDAPTAGTGNLPDASAVSCPTATTTVSDTDSLKSALFAAQPGDSIKVEDGTYTGGFTAKTSGTRKRPIFLCGSRAAVLQGDGIEHGYAFHLDGASYWNLVGFSVGDAQKGVMADGTVGSVIQGLTVSHTGDEGIHLRDDSTRNVVLGNSVSHTGLVEEKFGEGIYVGTAVSNWCSVTSCRPDRSDDNVVKDNTISAVTSEAVDIKEGTTGGVLIGNTFDGSDITGADSWVDVKGNNWLVKGNVGRHTPQDGFQTHQILDGWGDHNVFTGNRATVDGPGLGIESQPEESNVVRCDNSVARAGKGLSNIACS